ncbi:MAG: hypothetical protein GXX85_04220 [Ignavibacteria bacterium]|nr:hypothetical protein [Ignavibacteria bacterium]
MNISALILDKLYPILTNYSFKVICDIENIIYFYSSKIMIRIVFIENELSYYIEMGKKDEILYPLSNSILKNIFNSDLKLENATKETFVNNLCEIFQKVEGIAILNGNIDGFIKHAQEEIKKYNNNLGIKQLLNLAEHAWENNNYQDYIKIIEKLGIDKIPQVFLAKYKIAKKKYNL